MSWRLRDGVSLAETHYGGVLLDSISGDYWTLNPTGAAVLATLLAGGDLESAIGRLAENFGGDIGSVPEDVPRLVEELEAAELVVRT